MSDPSSHARPINLPSHTDQGLTYARARLWLGISAVGTWVLIALVALILRTPQSVLPTGEGTFLAELGLIALLLGIYALVNLPFDLLGGYYLPVSYGRSAARLRSFVLSWLPGACIHLIVLSFFAVALLQVGRWGGTYGLLATVTCGMLLLLVFQPLLARCVGRLERIGGLELSDEQTAELERQGVDASRTLVLAGRDEGFTGGIVGLPGKECIILPAVWLKELSPAQIVVVLLRRMGLVQSGSRRRGIAVASFWNLAGLAVIFYVGGVGLSSIADLVTMSFGMTIWSFIGLLTLPSISRPAVLLGDRLAADIRATNDLLKKTIRQLDRKLDDEPARDPFIETIFHPVPCVNDRIAALESHDTIPPNAWHAARMSLYLSWACLGLLSRAVHCNAGRPELWVMLPCD